MKLNPDQIAKWIPVMQMNLPFPELEIGEIIFDTREIVPELNPLFVALPGKRNGQDFIAQAILAGVKNFLTTEPIAANVNYWQTKHTLTALQELATRFRKRLQIPVIAITGTIAKTVLKETLARELHQRKIPVTKNIGSYNSQLGVPVSVINQMQENCLHLQEVAATEPGEIQKLATILQPDYGIFTRSDLKIKDSFLSQEERILEYLSLFRTCKRVWIPETELLAIELAKETGLPIQIVSVKGNLVSDLCTAFLRDWFQDLTIPAIIPEQVNLQRELHSEQSGLTVLTETYWSDEESLRKSVFYLQNHFQDKTKQVVLGSGNLTNPGDWVSMKRWVKKFEEQIHFFWLNPPAEIELPDSVFRVDSIQDLQKQFPASGTVVLLKGQGLEKLLPFYTKKINATQFRINLNHICANFHLAKKRAGGKKVIAMLKASAYGSGSWQIARELQMEGLDAIAVANVSEAIELRERGIRLPVLVMAADRYYPELLFQYQLEPVVWSLEFLKILQKLSDERQEMLTIHLEWDTGMSRLGFVESEISDVLNILQESNYLVPFSIFTHLSSSEDPNQDEFTQHQILRFETVFQTFQRTFPEIKTHFANTGGILRFSDFDSDFVRLGIGLYGVSPVRSESDFQEAGTFRTEIVQIHAYPAGTPVGYNQSEILTKDSILATIPVGYADGIPRKIGNRKYSVLLEGKRVPVVGKVCMDLMMLDISDVPEAKVGSEVILFGKTPLGQISVCEMAEVAETIPYEILAGISGRVQRIYVKE